MSSRRSARPKTQFKWRSYASVVDSRLEATTNELRPRIEPLTRSASRFFHVRSSTLSDGFQTIRDRLRERRAHGLPATASAVLAVRDEFVSDSAQRVMEEVTTAARWTEHVTSRVQV